MMPCGTTIATENYSSFRGKWDSVGNYILIQNEESRPSLAETPFLPLLFLLKLNDRNLNKCDKRYRVENVWI